ncbi:MAG: hypothetical protein Q9226_004065 [Calogaya cf. arnoldii]
MLKRPWGLRSSTLPAAPAILQPLQFLGGFTCRPVDIAPGMISNAKAALTSDRLTFLVGDCSQPSSFPGGPFDIVFTGWLFNNACDSATTTNMFRTVSANLHNGGRFFGEIPGDNANKEEERAKFEKIPEFAVVMIEKE